MGATVVDTSLTAAAWAKAKPKDYKGGDLTAALKAYETAAKAEVLVPAKPPKMSVSAFQDVAKIYKTAATELKKHTDALTKIDGASAKTTAELKKRASAAEDKAKKAAYNEAANVASVIGRNAALLLRELK